MLHYTQRGDAPIDRVHPEMRRQVVGQVILVLWAMRFSSGLWFSIKSCVLFPGSGCILRGDL
jgi:hypothetical protein